MVFSLMCYLLLQIRTVKISNVSLGATEQDIKEFFSFVVKLNMLSCIGLLVNSYSKLVLFCISLFLPFYLRKRNLGIFKLSQDFCS